MKIVCSNCLISKDKFFFSKNDKICDMCVDRSTIKNRRYSDIRYRKRPFKDRESFILYITKIKCRSNNISFNIDKSDIKIPEFCPILGIPLDCSDRDHTPSIDKTIPKLGYIKGNIDIISMRANRLKSDATLEEIEKLYLYMKNKSVL